MIYPIKAANIETPIPTVKPKPGLISSEKEKVFQKLGFLNVSGRNEAQNLQHCFSCQVTINQHDPNSANLDPWSICMKEGTLMECDGEDKACITTERRRDRKVYYVGMGCKQRAACMQDVPDWRFNTGKCNPEKKRGGSRCTHCCDNTVPSGARGCNLDGWTLRKEGVTQNWNVEMIFSNDD